MRGFGILVGCLLGAWLVAFCSGVVVVAAEEPTPVPCVCTWGDSGVVEALGEIRSDMVDHGARLDAISSTLGVLVTGQSAIGDDVFEVLGVADVMTRTLDVSLQVAAVQASQVHNVFVGVIALVSLGVVGICLQIFRR